QLGMWLYDAMSLFRTTRHRMLSARQVVGLEPSIAREGLRGGALYYDAQMDDARLCLANVVSAVEHGAIAVNYAEVVGFIREGRSLTGAQLRDTLTGRRFDVRATRIVNTTGAWLDSVCDLDRPGPSKLRTTKGTHIVVPRLTNRHAVTIQSSDSRVIF